MDGFIIYTLKSSLCLSAGYLLYCLVLRRETFHRFKRFILLGIIFIAIFVPMITLQVNSVVTTSHIQKLESAIVSGTPVVLHEQKPLQLLFQQQTSDRLNFPSMIYLAGASIQVILIFYSLAGIILMLRKSKKIKHQGIRLALVTSNVVPCCFGNLIIISEKDFREHGKAIIGHELTHLKAWHGLDLLVAEFYLVMTWYNPLSWLIRHELKQNHEFEADRNVLRQGIDESDYQLLLVRTVAGEQRYQLANQFNQSNIKTRINMMNKTKSSSGAFLKVLFFIPLIALLVQVFAQKEIIKASAVQQEHPHGKYLELAPDQLKVLGFESNPSGLFYKNIRFGRNGQGIMCLYFTDETYSGSIILRQGEQITGHSAPEKILKKQPLTSFDFYPVVVAGLDGSRTQDMSEAEADPNENLLPVQLNMAGLKLGKRADTLVFWFRPTQSLKKVLSPLAGIDDYLQPCPPDVREEKIKAKSH